MPRVFSEEATPEEANKKDVGGPCANLREDFKICMLNTDCVGVQRRKVKDCFDSDEVPVECVQLRTLLFECKRSLLDNRLRFRGKREY